MIQLYGQTPKQLFDRPHPMRQSQISSKSLQQPQVLDSVIGLRFGKAFRLDHQVFADQLKPLSLVPVCQNRVFGLRPGHVCLIRFGTTDKEALAAVATGACVIGVSRGWAMAWLKNGESPRPILNLEADGDRVVCLASDPGLATVWAGYKSGKLTAFNLGFAGSSELNLGKVRSAFGHRGAINAISPSRQWSIVVTASEDGSSIIWDSRKLTYVRSIESGSSSSSLSGCCHQLVKVSPSSGDIAIVTRASDLSLFTINGKWVGAQQNVEPNITSLAFSAQEEGLGVNVLATGHQHSGVIRLWSTWNLSPLRQLATQCVSSSLNSLAFSLDSTHLYASFEDGHLVIFERRNSKDSVSTPNFLDLSGIYSC